MSLENLTVTELKALAYDQQIQQKITEQNIKSIEEVIFRKVQEAQLRSSILATVEKEKENLEKIYD